MMHVDGVWVSPSRLGMGATGGPSNANLTASHASKSRGKTFLIVRLATTVGYVRSMLSCKGLTLQIMYGRFPKTTVELLRASTTVEIAILAMSYASRNNH